MTFGHRGSSEPMRTEQVINKFWYKIAKSQLFMLENISKLKYNRAYEAIYKQAQIIENAVNDWRLCLQSDNVRTFSVGIKSFAYKHLLFKGGR